MIIMINIFICLDSNCLIPFNCLINSILKFKNDYMFYVLVDNQNTLDEVQKFSNEMKIQIETKIFISNQDYDNFYLGRMNYARFFFDEYFEADDYIYIDTDIIVFGNIAEIWKIYNKNKTDDKYFAAVMVDNIQTLLLPNSEFRQIYQKYQNKGFNAGIYITSAFKWREKKIKTNILKLLEETRGHFKFGTQPLLNVMFYNKVIDLPIEWNVCSHTNITDISLIKKIILDFKKFRTINVNILDYEYISKNNIKLIHYAGPIQDKYWTIENYNAFGINGNSLFILNTFFRGKTKYLYSKNIDKHAIKYFYYYLNHGYLIKFTDNFSDINLDNDLIYLEN